MIKVATYRRFKTAARFVFACNGAGVKVWAPVRLAGVWVIKYNVYEV